MRTMSFDERELEELKRKKLEELQKQMLAKQQEEELKRREEAIKAEILRNILTAEARQRLANVKLVRPELAEQVENYLIVLAQSGRIPKPITDEEIKEILARLSGSQRRETRINIRERGW
ncbi:hypothetical protein IPA_08785 [Ignicoccus pacificus DSM 13166]|uniref:DNA-binding protein IPA_08785 n=1 Tax=Ignicoccus pacificus DSM 13166 TaxID=940294 RepID=A0A977KB64_9CREN|nr:hypothetical protein IPA_08785 [Ignicoccus pacificus DSM 13166]